MADASNDSEGMTTFAKVAAIAGGAVVFTAFAFGTQRLLKRIFPEPEQVFVLVSRQGALPGGEDDEEDE